MIIVGIKNGPALYLYANGFAEGTDGTLHFVKGHSYLINSNGECTIPSTFRGEPVTSVGAFAFDNNKKLRHLTIEEGIASISENAFSGCVNLETVSLPSSIKSIYSAAFWYCPSLREIVLPRALEKLGSYAFAGCESLTTVTLPKTFKTDFDGSAFSDCQAIVDFICPSGSAFSFDKERGLLMAGDSILLFQNIHGRTELALPGGASYIIQSNAFAHHQQLTKVYIPSGIYVRKNAFLDCPSLTVYCEASEWSSWFDEEWHTEDITAFYDHPADT